MGRNCTNSTSHRESLAYTAAAKCNDQKSIEILRDFWREKAVSPINNRGDTILHFIAIHGNAIALKLLIEERPVSGRDLRIKNKDGNTALHEAARFGRFEIVKMLVNLSSEIVLERNNKGETPIYVAAANAEKEVFTLLADNSLCDEFSMTRDDGSTVLHAAVTNECYQPDFAIQLVKMYPELARKVDGKGWSALNILATKHLSFRSGSIYTMEQMGTAPFFPMQALETFMYFCIPAVYEESNPNSNLEDPHITSDVPIERKRSSFVSFLLGNAWLGVIDHEKQTHILALTLARRLIKEQDWSFYASCVQNPLIQATKLGINELVVEIIQNYPQTADTLDDHEDGKNMMHIIVEQKNRFLFDYFMKNVPHIDRLLADTDQNGRTILHFAASVGSPFKFSSLEPPIKKTTWGYKTLIFMAWGVLWFKRVKYCVHPRLWMMKDYEDTTPKDLFDLNHSDIRKEAEKSIKDLGGPALILSTLLCTINFAAVFTVPGGFDQQTGIPIILNTQHSELWMLMFFLGAALYDSVFTMGTVLSILLSRFDSDEFYIALPVKYCTVLISVYYATAFTVLACVQALNVENIFKNRDVWWLIFLLFCLGLYMTLIVLDVCYIVFDYVYHFILYSIFYKGNKHVI